MFLIILKPILFKNPIKKPQKSFFTAYPLIYNLPYLKACCPYCMRVLHSTGGAGIHGRSGAPLNAGNARRSARGKSLPLMGVYHMRHAVLGCRVRFAADGHPDGPAVPAPFPAEYLFHSCGILFGFRFAVRMPPSAETVGIERTPGRHSRLF